MGFGADGKANTVLVCTAVLTGHRRAKLELIQMQLPHIRSIFGCALYKCVAWMAEAFLQVSGKRKINQK